MKHFSFLLFLLLWPGAAMLRAQQDPVQEIIQYREKQLTVITSGEDAPLWPEDSAGISYFDTGSGYLVKAKTELLKGEKPFKMPTYAGTTKEFIRYARLHFELNGIKSVLTAYRNVSIPGPLASLNNTLFIPFMDETNGEETYGGGRYLDIPVPSGTGEILLDFNKAYNPYCAYSDGYRCPVPPQENHLPYKIPAGEKQYTGAKRKRGVRPPDLHSSFFSEEERAVILSGDTASMLRVIQVTDSSELRVLRNTSADIDPKDPLLPLLAKRMLRAVQDTARPGVGIAAPQVGISRNLIWVQRFDKPGSPFELYLNPEITWASNLLARGPEGCLSIPEIRGDVNRHYIIRLSYLTPGGIRKEELLEGFVAVIFQHETDHLLGILFTDRLEKQEHHLPVDSAGRFFLEKPVTR